MTDRSLVAGYCDEWNGAVKEGPEAFGWWKVGERQEFRRNAAVSILPLVAVVLVLTR